MLTSCDVLVVGGGVAGAAAAISASRQGARTVLVEKESYLGGTGYAALLQHMCGLYVNGETFPDRTLNHGIAREVEQALIAKAPGRNTQKIGQVYVLPFRREELLSVLLELSGKERALEVYQNTRAVHVETRDNKIAIVRLRRAANEFNFIPGILIDCSGDAEMARLAGAGFQTASMEEKQMAGYILHVTGLQGADQSLSVKVPYYLTKAVEQGKFGSFVRYTMFSLGENQTEGFCKLSVGSDDVDMQEQAKAVHQYLASELPAFRDSSLATMSFQVMEREGRRICGEYTLTEQDALSARKFPDGVAKNSWPVELWDRSKGTIYKYVPRGDYYEIPFRCLQVKGLQNLLAAGRCISVSHEAYGSTRVMGACLAMGDAAGRAAAYWVRNGKYPETIKNF